MEKTLKFKVGKFLRPITLKYVNGNIELKFGYNKKLIQMIKNMEGARWHGFDEENPRKIWTIKNSQRNDFWIRYYSGDDPFEWYDRPMEPYTSNRPLHDHQIDMVKAILTYHTVILAYEMGLGKSLAAIEAMEHTNISSNRMWYVGPKSGVMAFKRELVKWGSDIQPFMMTYEKFTKVISHWHDASVMFDVFGIAEPSVPQFIVFDESSKIKTPTAKRSKAARHLADNMRREFGKDQFYIVELSGTPAPKTPVDWWNQCEVAEPGFIKEPNIHKFKKRLCIIVEKESPAGGVYPEIVTWLDDDTKCQKCGFNKDHIYHKRDFDIRLELNKAEENFKQAKENKTDPKIINRMIKQAEILRSYDPSFEHEYEPSENEIAKLYKRMRGLVHVRFKKDCVNLPEIQFEIINLEPNTETLRLSKIIKTKAPRVIQQITLLRELSDGFQYDVEESGEETCPSCQGKKEITVRYPKEGVSINEIIPLEVYAFYESDDALDYDHPNWEKYSKYFDKQRHIKNPWDVDESMFEKRLVSCDHCGGLGTVKTFSRVVDPIHTPKLEYFINDLDEHADIGRYIVWGGFTGTIDLLTRTAVRQGWTVLQVDGRGYKTFSPDSKSISAETLLSCMDGSYVTKKELLEEYPKVCFVGHPQAGGMALTLHASPTMLFFSNSFSGEARMQSIHRFHRLGMGSQAIVKDLIHLPVDKLVLENLNKKKKLQDISMGELEQYL